MKRLGFSALLFGAAISPALAGDPTELPASVVQTAQMPAPMLVSGMNWTGFHVGVDVGGGWGSDSDHEVTSATGLTSPFTPGSSASLSGVKAGGYLGWDWQAWGPLVLGVEGDAEFTSIDGTTTFSNTGTPPDFYKTTIESEGSLRARVGYAVNFGLPFLDSALPFVTGGLAIGRVKEHDVTPAGAAFTDSTKTLTGWTVGAGLDFALTPEWVGRVEYRHADFGNYTYMPAVFPAFTENHSITEDVFRVGLAYKFGAPPPPPPAPAAMPAPPPAAAKVFIVFFDWDKDVVTPEGHRIIRQAADAYRSGAPVQLQVTGYTDRSGSPGYNQRLSERRANNVARALAALGVPKNEMVVSGRGENDNRVPTAPGVREPQNRRVEIVAP